ncbi:MAG: hypothetical protein AB8G05_16035 [Oligoflexales bacterium]
MLSKLKNKIEEQILQLKADLPKPDILNEQEKFKLIRDIGGPRTVISILKAKKEFPLSRIPFLFNSLDTKLVINVLANEWDDILGIYDKSN